ncbi:MAG: hypothetical protein ACREJ3_14950, partial [Polyangiaceae bacterium]
MTELGTAGHLDVAERFLKLAEESDTSQGDARAWTIVLEFYAAVHWVRAYIRYKSPNANIASHDDVRSFFENMPEMQKIKRPYDVLKQSSQAVRLRPIRVADEGVRSDPVRSEAGPLVVRAEVQSAMSPLGAAVRRSGRWAWAT